MFNSIYQKGLLLLMAGTLSLSTVSGQSSILKQAARQYELMSYRDAITLYEQALSKGLSETDKSSAQTKLAYAYRQVRDTQNAERVYRELLASGKEYSGEDSKAFLYFAQALASNGKYRESSEAYTKYNLSQNEDGRGKGFTKLYADVAKLSKNAGSYKVDYLDINSSRADFSPMYYEKGLVFCSGRGEGEGAIKRVFNWDKSAFLDLYYLPDLNTANGSQAASLGASEGKKSKRGRNGRGLGTDEYTAPTANDNNTVGTYYGNQLSSGMGYEERPVSESDRFSRSINSKYHEGPATFTEDFNHTIFTRNNYNDGRYGKSSDNINKLKLYTADKKNGSWANVQEAPFNSDEYSTGHPTLTKDNRLMYFVSDMPGGMGGTDLYAVSYNNGQFGQPINLGKGVNTKGNEMFPFVDERGNLYFASDGHPGLGDLDMFFVEMKGGTPSGKVMNLGAPINSSKDDFGILTDGERTSGYFSSNRKRGGIDDDIYRFTRDGSLYGCRELTVVTYDAETKMPLDNVEIGLEMKDGKADSKVTDANGKTEVCLDEDQNYMFKATREGYIQNTVGFSTTGNPDDQPSRLEIPLQRPKAVEPTPAAPSTVYEQPAPVKKEPVVGKMAVLQGRAIAQKDRALIEGATVTLRNECDGTTQTQVTGPDGSFEFEIVPNCSYTLNGTKEKYGTQGSKISGLPPERLPEYLKTDLLMFEAGDVVRLDNIYYDLGKYNIRRDAAMELDKLADLMRKYPNMRIELRSHTDSRSSTESNAKLSDNRAKAAVEYLRKKGIDTSRMVGMGYGESVLVNQCADGVKCSEEEHQQNRRTEFKVLSLE